MFMEIPLFQKLRFLINLSSSSSDYSFSSGALNNISQVAINEGESSVNIYYKDNVAGESTITLTSGDLIPTTQKATIFLEL